MCHCKGVSLYKLRLLVSTCLFLWVSVTRGIRELAIHTIHLESCRVFFISNIWVFIFKLLQKSHENYTIQASHSYTFHVKKILISEKNTTGRTEKLFTSIESLDDPLNLREQEERQYVCGKDCRA